MPTAIQQAIGAALRWRTLLVAGLSALVVGLAKDRWFSSINRLLDETVGAPVAEYLSSLLASAYAIPATIFVLIFGGVFLHAYITRDELKKLENAPLLPAPARGMERHKIPEPNMRLEDVVKRITGNATFPHSNEPASMPILHACEALREKALLGILSVFGGIGWRTTPPADYDRMIRAPIPREYWKDHQLDVIGFLGAGDGDYRGRTQDLIGTWGDPTDYYGIWFDKDEINALWPSSHSATSRGGDVMMIGGTIRGGDGGFGGDGGSVTLKGGDGGGKI